MKTCLSCKKEKPEGDFNKLSKVSSGLNPRCRPCWKLFNKQFKRKPTDLSKKRDQHYKNRYGISLEEYNNLKISQEFCCAICKKHEQLTIRQRLVVDHCHGSLKVRGLLCDNCNHGLGKFKDNKEYLLNAIEYLGVGETVIHSSEDEVQEASYEEIKEEDGQ